MSESCFIGIDIGTSGAKTVIVDERGRLLAGAGQEYPILTPQPGWAEQDPEEWLAAAINGVRNVIERSQIDPRRVAGIGLGGQMHSLVCVDEHVTPLRPAILWADQRSAAQVERLTAQMGKQNLAAWTGNPLATGFMLASLAWLAENEPDTLERARWYLLPKDYVRWRLTGAVGAEHSDASSTLLYDPHTRGWSAAVLDAAGVRPERLPALHESHDLAGYLLSDPAAACGLPEGIPVVFGGSDVSLQALALGVVEPGTVSCTIGTGGQLFAPLQSPSHDPQLRLHLFCHALPETWHHEAAILSAGLALRWLRDQLWPAVDYASLANAAQTVQAAQDGVYFLPFLTGERTPYMDSTLRASFTGLGLRHGQPHLVRAVMEGVVFALRQGLNLMRSLGTPVERLIATGGAVRHPLWLKLQADIFNRPIFTASEEDTAGSATARGAALLAAVGSGVYADVCDALQRMVAPPVEAAQPDPRQVELYEAAYQKYCQWADEAAHHKIL